MTTIEPARGPKQTIDASTDAGHADARQPRWTGPLPTWSETERIPFPCQSCGAATSDLFNFEQIIGLGFFFLTRSIDGRWCPPCAIAIGRRTQTKTAFTGWGGFRTVTENGAVLVENARQLRRAATLDVPIPTPTTKSAGLPVLIRIALILTLIVAVIAVAIATFS